MKRFPATTFELGERVWGRGVCLLVNEALFLTKLNNGVAKMRKHEMEELLPDGLDF